MSTVQNFKGDAKELKMKSLADSVFDATDASLDEFYAGGFDCNPFLLAMYDDNRMPFSERINRDTFVDFIKQALANFPFSGTFEVYLSILKSVFGDNSEIRFSVPNPGQLLIEVLAVATTEFTFVARQFDGSYIFYDMVDYVGDVLLFRGVAGIDTQYELELLFSELIPIGIAPTITLELVEISDFAGEGDDLIIGEDDMGIIFVE